MGWQLAWTSGYLTQPVVLVAINARLATSALESIQQMVAATFSSVVRLWSITEDGDSQDVGKYWSFLCPLVFLDALSHTVISVVVIGVCSLSRQPIRVFCHILAVTTRQVIFQLFGIWQYDEFFWVGDRVFKIRMLMY